MAEQYDNTNSGAIFKNDKKGNEKAPDYKGKINVDGKDKQIALWLRESKAGNKFFSVKISDMYAATGTSTPAVNDLPEAGDLPF